MMRTKDNLSTSGLVFIVLSFCDKNRMMIRKLPTKGIRSTGQLYFKAVTTGETNETNCKVGTSKRMDERGHLNWELLCS
jgi:hypothetical protein